MLMAAAAGKTATKASAYVARGVEFRAPETLSPHNDARHVQRDKWRVRKQRKFT